MIPFRRLVHRRRAAAPAPARGRLATFTDLRVGDHVVHEDHGIARFAGFETKTVAGVTRDYLELAYRGSDRVFAPTDQLAKITRYVGTGGEPPQLSALGSARWEGVKARARRAARELAGELLNLYAERRARRGHAFPPDGEWQLMLERSFPYRETADQLEAIEAVKGDLESERPMDRLICGDVGYGKTEVALRAAQKAVSDGKQVMMLVPTTILAQQHLGTFRERLAEFPIEVEMVSRLRKPAAIRATLAGFAEGKVDILIGTHRLLSRDVRAADLGLLIVDEEQRFGVRQKELLRQLKLKVDVLSMSATPIPRTLQMSLAGVRDISVIETPPEGRRPIRTYVGPYDEELVRRAIQRESDRGGQAFFLHNRIETLHRGRRAPARALPRRPLRRGPRPDGRGRPGANHARVPARRGRLPGGDDDHRVGPRHPAGEHADRRARRRAGPGPGLPDPWPGGAVARARLRLPPLSLRGGAQLRGRGPPGHALRPHRAGLRVRDLHARPRAARRRRPARRGAVGPRGGGRLRALRLAARRRRAGASLRRRRRRGRGPGAAATSRSTPTCPPTTSPSRRRRSTSTGGWRAPASRASCAPCATSSATVSARCPSRSRACSSSSAPGSSWAASAPARSSSAASGCR